MIDPNEPTREQELPADEVSGAGYGNNAEQDGDAQEEADEGGGDGAEGRPSEL